MAKQTRDKRAIRSCNSKNGQKQYKRATLYCLFFELHLLIALLSLVCFAIVLSVLWITSSDCPFVPCLFCHCIVCSLNYSFWLLFCPLSVLPLFCLFFELHLLIALLSLVCFAIVLSVLWITASDCPFVPCLFCHCFVCSLYYCFWLPFCSFFVFPLFLRAIRRCNSKDGQK
jgi:uncharacterized membrane protein